MDWKGFSNFIYLLQKEQGVSKCHNKISLRSISLFHSDPPPPFGMWATPCFFRSLPRLRQGHRNEKKEKADVFMILFFPPESKMIGKV